MHHAEVGFLELFPVSYTNLDVYKRQLSYWNQEIKTAMYNALFRSRSRYATILWPALFGINKRLNIPGTTAVSYTHLDVYKRQLQKMSLYML